MIFFQFCRHNINWCGGKSTNFFIHKAGERIRTADVQLGKLIVENHNDLKNQTLTKSQNPVSAVCSDISLQKDTKNAVGNPAENPAIAHDLEQIITAWPELPNHIKEAIKTLVNTHFSGQIV